MTHLLSERFKVQDTQYALHGDYGALCTLQYHLASNAAKFTQKGQAGCGCDWDRSGWPQGQMTNYIKGGQDTRREQMREKSFSRLFAICRFFIPLCCICLFVSSLDTFWSV